MLIAPSSPTFDNRKASSSNNNSKQRNSIKSQEDALQYRYRVKSETNPNAYHDKITDQKFFNRNFKIKPETTQNNSANSNNSMNTVDLIERNYTNLGTCLILLKNIST